MKRQFLFAFLLCAVLLVPACQRRNPPGDARADATPTPPASAQQTRGAITPTLPTSATNVPRAQQTRSAITLTPGTTKAVLVPAEYKKLYDYLQATLDQADAQFTAALQGRTHPITFAAELIVADSNRGEELLRPEALPATQLYLDRLRALGVRGVKLSVQYPLLTPSFPRYAQYVEFYRQVAREVKKREMVLAIQASVIFAQTNFSSLKVNFTGLTLERFKAENRQMAQTILDELRPDYLVIVGEPDTAATLTGIKELNDPAQSVAYVKFILEGLERGATKIAAGTGTWSPLAFAERYAQDTTLDCIVLHMYPVGKETLANALAMAQAAHANGKCVLINEAWLYKTLDPRGGNHVAASEEIFRRDAYSFWQPLDQKFLRVMTQLADLTQADFLSFFWSMYFWGYAEYDPKLEKLPYSQVRQQANQIAYKNLQANQLSATGTAYRDLIAQREPANAGATHRDIPYCTADGVALKLDLAYPKNFANKPAPIAVFIHGGGWTAGNKNGGTNTADAKELLARGYIVAALDYRLAPQFKWPAQITDVKCAIRYLRAHATQYQINPTKIGVWGSSAGGHLVAMLGTTDTSAGFDVGEYLTHSSRVQAVVDLFGPADLPALLSTNAQLVGNRVFGSTSRDDSVLIQASPITYITRDDPPFLILQGDQDKTVPLAQSETLNAKLQAGGVPTQLVIVKNAGHGFAPTGGPISPTRTELTKLLADHFDKHLK